MNLAHITAWASIASKSAGGHWAQSTDRIPKEIYQWKTKFAIYPLLNKNVKLDKNCVLLNRLKEPRNLFERQKKWDWDSEFNKISAEMGEERYANSYFWTHTDNELNTL